MKRIFFLSGQKVGILPSFIYLAVKECISIASYLAIALKFTVFLELRLSENAHDLISVHIFTQKGGYHVNYPSNILQTVGKKYSRTPYHLLRGIFHFQCSLKRLYEQTIESFIL